jgi:hypothetical protein
LRLAFFSVDAMSLDPPPLTGKSRRLKDIQDALAGRPIALEREASNPTQPQVKPRTGRKQRLKDIEDALAGRKVDSDKTPTNIPTVQIAKRTSRSATPEPLPTAKRRRLQSPCKIPVKVSPTHLNPGANHVINVDELSDTESIELQEPSGVVCLYWIGVFNTDGWFLSGRSNDEALQDIENTGGEPQKIIFVNSSQNTHSLITTHLHQ